MLSTPPLTLLPAGAPTHEAVIIPGLVDAVLATSLAVPVGGLGSVGQGGRYRRSHTNKYQRIVVIFYIIVIMVMIVKAIVVFTIYTMFIVVAIVVTIWLLFLVLLLVMCICIYICVCIYIDNMYICILNV